MCGILGIFNHPDATNLLAKGLTAQKNRGQDAYGISDGATAQITKDLSSALTYLSTQKANNLVAHNLHAIVSLVPQPLQTTSTFLANCEIYNWEEMRKKENAPVHNDAHLLQYILDKETKVSDKLKKLQQCNGVYALAWWNQDTLLLVRDILGEKPIHYVVENNAFAFASEKKTLVAMGFSPSKISELNPRIAIDYNIRTQKIQQIKRPFFALPKPSKKTRAMLAQEVAKNIETAILQRLPDKKQKVGILFSGGIDSTLIAYVLKKHAYPFTCYTAALHDDATIADDLAWSRKIAAHLGFPLVESVVSLDKVETEIKEVIQIIESSNVVKVGVAIPFHLCAKAAAKDNVRVLFSGLGSEEVYAGYQRHEQSQDINKECISGLRKMYERDLYRDDVITMAQTIELRLPFLDFDVIRHGLTIPAQFKIVGDVKKAILRDAAKILGLPQEYADRPKKAAQYGSRFDKAIEKLAHKAGYDLKSQYLNTFFPAQNQRLCALLSTGKDSVFALYTMQRQNYPIVCAVTIQSKNPDSYMFHTPTTDIAKLQAKSMQFPLITQLTTGDKEKELKDLTKAIKTAIQKYNIDGIVTGALYSVYQRERIEAIAEELGIKVYAPLWHLDQEKEVRQILDEGFEIILTKVAADGLDASWLAKKITNADVDALVKLHKKNGLHVAGEGGEYESLVIDGPNFTHSIKILDSEIKKDGICATLEIKKAELKEK
ncbi:MAG TPA: diphthine--ammonia ligase [Acidobacteriota bacterium]|nr:diphthine--ammonia ligase [Acidobacteriota bacterium]